MRPIIPFSLVIAIGILIAILASSDYEEYSTERDQRNLRISLDDCDKLFPEGNDRNNCINKSIETFGTEYQKNQWELNTKSP